MTQNKPLKALGDDGREGECNSPDIIRLFLYNALEQEQWWLFSDTWEQLELSTGP